MDASVGQGAIWMDKEIIEQLERFLEKREEIQFAILFGSIAKGTSNKLSDVDIAVMLAPDFKDSSPYGYQATLTADLMQELKRNDVDVVILNEAPILLKYEIMRYGDFIHIRDKQARIQFQVDTLNQYEDFKHLYRVHEEAFHKRWRKPTDIETA